MRCSAAGGLGCNRHCENEEPVCVKKLFHVSPPENLKQFYVPSSQTAQERLKVDVSLLVSTTSEVFDSLS